MIRTRTTRRRTALGVLATSVAVVSLVGCAPEQNRLGLPADSPFVLDGVSGVERLQQLTGASADSPNATDQWAVYGTDLGSMFEAHGKTWFVFGDTFGEREPGFTGGGGSFWRSNTLGYSTDTDPSDGISLDGMIVDDIGLAAELLPSKKTDGDEMTVIPTHGFEAADTMYLHWMSVRHWGEPGEWEANDAGLASSVDEGKTWTVLDSPRWGGESRFVQVSPAHIEQDGADWLYFWGITHGRFGGVGLMRVPAEEVEKQSSYEYFTGADDAGAPQWGSDPDAAELVVDDTVGELSVVWNDYLDRFIMTYLKEGAGVVMREGISPWGPWGDPIDLVSASDVPGLYAPFMNEQYVGDGGRTIYFTLSVWDPYNVFWYKADLTKK